MDKRVYEKVKQSGKLHKIPHKPDCDDEMCDNPRHYSLRGWRYDSRYGWVEK